MADQTQAALSTGTIDPGHMTISDGDRTILRELARRVAELAARPEEEEKRRLWYAHNALEPTRPLIFCDPENGWNEIIPPGDLTCTGMLAREWEFSLRKEVFWGESMGDDRVVEPLFAVPWIYFETDWGMHERKIGGTGGGSYVWEAPLSSYDDFDKLRFPRITVDRDASARILSLAEDVMGGILAVKRRGTWWWTLGMTWTLVNIRGLGQIMYDVYDHPDDLKRLMGFLRDGTLARLDFLEQNGLLSLNNDGTYVGSGGFGWTRDLPGGGFDGETVRTCDMWGFCESQETSTWSPDMFGEFIFPYQLPIMQRFGRNCYGCCEALDERWRFVRKIPGLRRVSVSPWADRRVMAEQLGGDHIYSLKPLPTDLAVPVVDTDHIRRDLRSAMETCRANHLEVIMKDNHTIGGNPENVRTWCRIAREESERA